MHKKIWVIANWKSNKTIAEALEWVSYVGPRIETRIEKRDYLKAVVCPVFSQTEEVKKAVMVGDYPLIVGAQDLSPYPEGAYTGEEAAKLLKEFVDLVILGHSERRQNFAETDKMVAEKTKQALAHDIIPLVCIQGENTPVPPECKLVAYEPIFAIGTGNPDTPENANRIAASIKQKHGQEVEVLYGGSVTSENIGSFINQEHLNGVLIGKASLIAEEFVKIVNFCI